MSRTRSAAGWAGSITPRSRFWPCGPGPERQRLGGENPGGDGGADAGDLHRAVSGASPVGVGDRRGDQSCPAANEEGRIYPWYSETKTFPPRRPRPGSSVIRDSRRRTQQIRS